MPDPTPYAFDLDGGRLCLDFANTRSATADHLSAYADLVAFAAQSNLLTPATAARLHAAAERAPGAAAATFLSARTLRDALRRLFLAVANQARPAEPDLDVLNAHLAASLPHARVVAADGPGAAYEWGWAGTELDSPLWPIVRSAADVLTSDQERPLVRECGASDCAWLFIDATRNRSRQWCSMTSCGNREKARRHYRRVRAQRTADVAEASDAAVPPTRRPRRRTAAAPSGDASATAE
jgi:predicted RNA-binding Zn ribbon-like protein